jgi:hypothetical protein
MSLRTKVGVQVEIERQVVIVSLHMEHCSASTCSIAYAGVLGILDDLKEQEAIKWIRCRRDYFVVMPQNDWTPQELSVAIKQRLRL